MAHFHYYNQPLIFNFLFIVRNIQSGASSKCNEISAGLGFENSDSSYAISMDSLICEKMICGMYIRWAKSPVLRRDRRRRAFQWRAAESLGGRKVNGAKSWRAIWGSQISTIACRLIRNSSLIVLHLQLGLVLCIYSVPYQLAGVILGRSEIEREHHLRS